MRRYLLFAGFDDGPRGGWEDFRGHFDGVEEAETNLFATSVRFGRGGWHTADWYHVVDTHPRWDFEIEAENRWMGAGKFVVKGRLSDLVRRYAPERASGSAKRKAKA